MKVMIMDKSAYDSPDFIDSRDEDCISTFHGVTLPAPPQPIACPKCNNLVQNPSFEASLTGWVTNNVTVTDNSPFEGTQQAAMGPGVASIFQDIPLDCPCPGPLFLSFNAKSSSIDPGNRVAEVLWLDQERRTIASGLRILIPSNIRNFDRITFFDITDQPPEGTAWARLLFSKAQDPSNPMVNIDQVILAPVSSINLVQNPGFELGLTGWTTSFFKPNFIDPFTGSAQAFSESDGTLFQDVSLTEFPINSSFLLSFTARTVPGSSSTLTVPVLWQDRQGNQIGPPGLALFIPSRTLGEQGAFLTYLGLTQPAPTGAVTARIAFTPGENSFIYIDQVIFAAVKTTNLVQNPSFESALNNWTAVNFNTVETDSAYVGRTVARAGSTGGAIFQDVPIPGMAGDCFLLNFGLGYRLPALETISPGNTVIKVIWLDNNDQEIGLGLSIVAPRFVSPNRNYWLVYTGITEPAPPSAVKARVQFTLSAGDPETFLDIDNVVLGSLV